MKFKFFKTSKIFKDKEIEINALEDLEFLQKKYGMDNSLIIDFKEKTIEYYDDYRE